MLGSLQLKSRSPTREMSRFICPVSLARSGCECVLEWVRRVCECVYLFGEYKTTKQMRAID